MHEPLARHELVWLAADAPWQARTPGAQARLRAWFAAGHPAIVARGDRGDDAQQLRLGVPLPPAEGKQRLSLSAAPGAVLRQRAPPTLDEVCAQGQAVADWRTPLHALQTLAAGHGLVPRVFGAFAWQALTGLPYVRAGSDIDLLWQVPTPAQASALLADLARWEQRHGRRVDGEVLLPDGSAVSWRELAGDSAQLLVKALRDCRLQPRAALLQAWAA
ncbi:malonate decarboxylase holo-[acyl-carrier-protein] synthase [Xanthomonas theicola]|uniref:Malonate decarboxylase holo-[acyl-carrier-protein] synthase n=1 Tax=Xanthomonas theicola TaxID=56464 RepID=A0A2S6ZED3_9XANT|nr:malonate decarboxylase holo-[acyl-carrier-protein] synthase [Xanthomonas theicola]PPT90627.1 malonate decarboxylase holo-[acyl-carrier-protein] synthase [Xanthomonas theicola]QNH25884.1 malonate decarboxylase holo-[acyl-carrier-protein] synthase [Xanthomonas theicola]